MRGADPGLIVAPEPAAPVSPLDKAPTFSVVIPAYQAAGTIGETVDSVLAQTLPPVEVIVSDDGSTDDLARALAPYGDALRIIRRPHAGIAAARNAGVEAASGEFVLIVDADDLLLPGKLAALAELAMARPDLDLLATDVFFEKSGERVGRFGDANPFKTSDQRAAILKSCFVGWPAARRSRLIEAGGFDDAFHTSQDWECWIRMIVAGSRAGLVDEPLSVYRVHPRSITAARVAALRERAQMLEKTLAASALSEREREALARGIAASRARATLAEAEEALRNQSADRRRRALAAARARAVPLRARVAAIAAAAAPGIARAWLRRSRSGTLLERSVPGDRTP